jgi:GSH-dependent disulfide-bond oxidoreductase
MIDLYFWMTPNGYKISILLEELALPYRVIPVHIGKGEQFAEDFLRISPNGKIPAITDPNGSDGALSPTDTVSSSFRAASEITTRSCNG